MAINAKYIRHRRFARVRYGRKMLDFLDTVVTALTGTATAKTVVPLRTTNTKPEVVFTFSGQPSDGDTVTLGLTTYTFKTELTPAANEVLIGAAATNTVDNLVSAVTAGAGAGTTYGTGTVANTLVTASNVSGSLLVQSLVAANLKRGRDIPVAESAANVTVPRAYLDGPAWTATGHGLDDGDGPFLLTNSGGALPAGSPSAGTELYVHVIDTNTIALATSLDAIAKGNFIQTTSAGTGTHSIARSLTAEGVFNAMKGSKPATIQAVEDIDDL